MGGPVPLRGSCSLKLRVDMRDGVRTLAIMALTSMAAFAVRPERGEVAGALVFVLGIMLAGALSGLGAALIAAMAGFLLYNFYFAEPILMFRLTTGSDILPLVIFNLCALLAGVLAGRLKDRAQAATRANCHLASLLDVSESLQTALTLDDIPGVLAHSALGKSGLRVGLLRVHGDRLQALGNGPAAMESADIAIQAMHSVDAVIHQDGLTAWRLNGSDGAVGVMLIEEAVADRSDPAFLSAFANLVALAIERALLSERLSETAAHTRTEKLKSALLSSVSHDFRTPLTAISASASSLIAYRDQLDQATSARLLRGIVDECERLNRYTANLLEIGRLEAGEIPRQLQILSVSEMLASAIQRVRPRAGARRIERVLAGDDLLVTADAALFELVLVNVLGNSIVYSEDGTRILIECEKENSFCRITIADEGEGIPADDLHHIFDRFYRVDRAEPSPRGSGLGLAITKGFVEALGGSVEARTPGVGKRGTRIIIRLPLAQGERQP